LNRYRHTQIGWAIIIPLLAFFVVAWLLVPSLPANRAFLPCLAGVVVLVLSLFGTLTITVAGGWVICRFGVGLVWRRIPVSDVRVAEAVRNKWYYGWGIRLSPHGWLWNVSGLKAVELTFANGKKFRIGTDEPEMVRQAIRDGSRDLICPHDP